MAKVYTFLADGMEEVECLGVCDVLARAGVEVKLVSVMGRRQVTGSHGFTVTADALFEEITDDADVLFLPGGLPGADHLRDHEGLAAMLKAHGAAGKRLAAICAAPGVLGGLGLLEGRRATCFPGFEEELDGAEVTGELVTTDGNIITARGAGAAMLFGAAICDKLRGGGGREILAEMQHPEI